MSPLAAAAPVPAIPAHTLLVFLAAVGVLLLAALLLGRLALLDAVGQLGVLLLVGLTGAEIDVAFLRRRGGAAARIGLAGLLLPLGLGVATGHCCPGRCSTTGPTGTSSHCSSASPCASAPSR